MNKEWGAKTKCNAVFFHPSGAQKLESVLKDSWCKQMEVAIALGAYLGGLSAHPLFDFSSFWFGGVPLKRIPGNILGLIVRVWDQGNIFRVHTWEEFRARTWFDSLGSWLGGIPLGFTRRRFPLHYCFNPYDFLGQKRNWLKNSALHSFDFLVKAIDSNRIVLDPVHDFIKRFCAGHSHGIGKLKHRRIRHRSTRKLMITQTRIQKQLLSFGKQ